MVGNLIVAYVTNTAVAAFSIAQTVAAFAINFAVSSIVTRVFGQSAQGPQDSGTREQVPPSNVNAIPIVYGDAYLGGTFVDAVLSIDQKTMYYVMAVSCISPNGQFSFDTSKFYYGDRLITFDGTDQTRVISLSDEAIPANVDPKIDGNLFISLYVSDAAGNITSPNGAAAPTTVMGGSDIEASLRWVSTGPAPRKMNGLAFAIIKLNYNQDAGTTSLSPITFYAKHYLNSTGAAKPGDVWYDYITNKQYGGAVGWLPDGTFSPNFVNAASATALNAYSDQTITYTPSTGGSATQARYRMNGVLDAGQTVLSNLDKIMSCCDSWMAYNAALGQWSIVINKAETAAYAFNDNNIIGEIRVSATDITQSINQVEAKFPDKGSRDQPNFVNIATPPLLRYPNEPDNKYSVTFDLCNDSVQAQYLSNRILEQAREDLIVSFSTTYYGIQVDAGDVVSVTNSDYGWTNKLFRVVKVNEASLPDGGLGAKLEMNEYSAAVYDDASITQYTPVPNSDIPSAIFFSALSTPTVLSSSPSTTPATFVVRTVVPVTGRVTFGTLYYTTSTSPAAYDWKVLQTASTPLGTSATNGANYDFANLQLSAGTYYFTYVVGNELGSSARSPTSSAFVWSPVNSESGNVAALQIEVDALTIDVADKVSKTTANILTGTIVPQDLGGIKVGSIAWNTSGIVTSGSGIAITENGIVGAKAGVPNFTIDTAGNALFKGDINTLGDAYFAGDNLTTSTFPIGASNLFVDYSCFGNGATSAASSSIIRAGVLGQSSASVSSVNIGVFGYAADTGKGYGVIGVGGYGGGYFQSTGPNFSALTAQAFNATSNALTIIVGKFLYGTVTIEPPPNNTTTYLRGDGQFASTSPLMTSATANSGSATASSSNINFLGSTSTGIAGAYVGTSASGSTVTFTVQTTSPSDIRLKEEIADADVGLAFVKQLRPVSYKLKADPRHQKGYGFIADEVEDLIGLDSSLVYEEPNWQVGDEIGFKTIHYPSYIAVLTKAIQELSAKVDEQQKLIEALQNKG
jgi:hypothetical protein